MSVLLPLLPLLDESGVLVCSRILTVQRIEEAGSRSRGGRLRRRTKGVTLQGEEQLTFSMWTCTSPTPSSEVKVGIAFFTGAEGRVGEVLSRGEHASTADRRRAGGRKSGWWTLDATGIEALLLLLLLLLTLEAAGVGLRFVGEIP